MMNLDPGYYKIKSKSRRASNQFHYLRVFVENNNKWVQIDDEALQERKSQSYGRLSAYTDSNARVYFALLGVNGKCGITSCTFCNVDYRFISDGPIFYISISDGGNNVYSTAVKPDSTGPDASKDNEMDARCIYLYVFVVPCRFGDLLGNQQYTVYYTAVHHY